jgi:hypothetical protein
MKCPDCFADLQVVCTKRRWLTFKALWQILWCDDCASLWLWGNGRHGLVRKVSPTWRAVEK